jgi:monoamine oxidase
LRPTDTEPEAIQLDPDPAPGRLALLVLVCRLALLVLVYNTRVNAIVIGAGLAGLSAADELSRAGVEVRVFEARDRVGGRVWSVPLAGAVVERGAEFVLPENSAFREMAARFGLTLVRKGTYYGAREPRGIGQLTAEQLDEALSTLATMRPLPGEDVAALLARAAVDPEAASMIRARIELSCAYPASDLEASVLSEAGTAFGTFDTHTIHGGNQRLAQALADAIGIERLAFGAPVTRVRHCTEGVAVTAGGHERSGDVAVLAIPASVTGALEFDPPLSERKAAALAAVRYGHAAKLFIPMRAPAPASATMSVPERFWCFTQLGGDGQPLPVLGVFAGTSEALSALELSSGFKRWAAAVSRLRPDLSLDLDAALLATWSDDRWVRGAYSARSVSSPMDDDELARPLGRLAFAGEHTAGSDHGMMEGAIRSGVRAARDLLAVAS